MWKKLALAAGFLLAAHAAHADMYPDASNAKQPQALDNIGKPAAVFQANAYGNCTWDATHDVGPCVNAALTAAAQAGGGAVQMPGGTFGVATKIVWPQTGEALALRCGPGGGGGATTTMKWIGANGGRIMEIRAAGGGLVAAPQLHQVRGAEVTHCRFHSGGLAADGLYIASAFGGHFDDLFFGGNWNGGNVMTLTADLPTTGGAQNNTIDNLIIFSDGTANTSNQLLLGAHVDSTTTYGNAAVNEIRNLWISNGAGTGWGIICRGCDNNLISGRIHMNNAVDLTVAVSGSHMFSANGNRFTPFYYYGTFIARGQTTFPSCSPYPTCTYSNYVSIDETNGTPAPTIEPGAGLYWHSNSGYAVGSQFYGNAGRRAGIVAAQDLSLRGSCPANANAYGAQATTYLCNSQNSAYVAFDNVAGSRYMIHNSGSADSSNLRFYRYGGTGLFEFSDTVQLDNGLIPQVFDGGVLGTATLPFQGVYAGGLTRSNASHTWAFSLGLPAGTADADASLEKDGFRVITFNRFATTIDNIVTPQRTPGPGSSCIAGTITADATYLYACTALNTWKRVALTGF